MYLLKTFYYIAFTTQKKIIDGTLRAYNEQLAKAQLNLQAFYVLYLNLVTVSYFPRYYYYQHQKKTLVLFKQILPLINRGLNINEILLILTKTYFDKQVHTCLKQIQRNLHAGLSFSNALKQCSKLFNPLTILIFSIAEKTSSFSSVLNYFVSYQQQKIKFYEEIKKISTYPFFLLFITLMISLFLIINVLPELAQLYHSFKAPLPKVTRFLLRLLQFNYSFWLLVILLLSFSFLTLRFFILSSLLCKKICLRLIRALPLVGTMKKKLYWSHCTTLIGLLLNAGLPLTDSLNHIATTLHDPNHLKELYLIIYHIKNGMSLSQSLIQYSLFSPAIIQLIKIGEETGQLSNMLLEASSLLNEEINSMLSLCNALIQPLMICLLGCCIASLLLALYWPLFALNQFI